MQYNRINQLMGKALTILLLTIMTGTLFYLLEYPSLAYGDVYSDWVDSGSPDYNAINGGSSGGGDNTPARPHCTPDEVIGQTNDCNGNMYCTRNIQHREDCSTYEGGQYNCRKVRGQCNYWGVCRPRYCDAGIICDPQCFETNTNTKGGTCNHPFNGIQTRCLYTTHSSGKGCVPSDAPNQNCWIDACHYPLWKCDAIANDCVYTKANTSFDSNVHTNN